MAYCTLADIQLKLPDAQLIRLTDDEDAGVINTDRVQEAIDAAADEIDGWIGGRVALPLTKSVPMLTQINVDMAIYHLYSRYQESIPDTRETRYKDAVKLLEKINAGDISLGVQAPPEPPAAGNYEQGLQTSARTKDFSETTMAKF